MDFQCTSTVFFIFFFHSQSAQDDICSKGKSQPKTVCLVNNILIYDLYSDSDVYIYSI